MTRAFGRSVCCFLRAWRTYPEFILPPCGADMRRARLPNAELVILVISSVLENFEVRTVLAILLFIALVA